MTRTPITVASMFDIQCTSNWSSIPIWKHSYKSMNPSFCRNQSVHILHYRLICCNHGSSSCLSVSDFLHIHHLSCRLTSTCLLLYPDKERTVPAVPPRRWLPPWLPPRLPPRILTMWRSRSSTATSTPASTSLMRSSTMTTAQPGCSSAHASRPSQVSACIVNRLCPPWQILEMNVFLAVWEGRRGWPIMRAQLCNFGRIE